VLDVLATRESFRVCRDQRVSRGISAASWGPAGRPTGREVPFVGVESDYVCGGWGDPDLRYYLARLGFPHGGERCQQVRYPHAACNGIRLGVLQHVEEIGRALFQLSLELGTRSPRSRSLGQSRRALLGTQFGSAIWSPFLSSRLS